MDFERGLSNLDTILKRAGQPQDSEEYLNFVSWQRQLRTSIENERLYAVLSPQEQEHRERIFRELDRLALRYANKSFLDLCAEKFSSLVGGEPLETPLQSSSSGEGDFKSDESVFSFGHALLIGVGCYKANHLSVPVTAHDAESLGSILTDPALCAYPENHVVTLTNEDANKARILTELEALGRQVHEGDNSTVVIFFSGHGWQQDGYYFLPHETETFIDAGKVRVKLDTALTNKDFLNKVRQIPAQRLVILFNTCFAGGVGTALSPKIGQLPELAPVPLGLYDELLEGGGRVIISSSKTDESSWVKGGSDNSLFVVHLLSALRGQGIKTDDKTVNILDIFKHLSKAVPADAKTIGVVQTPVLKAYDVTQDFPIALLLGGKGLT